MSVHVSVSINEELRNMDKQLEKAIKKAIDKLTPILTRYGKTHHRYTNRTGELTSNTSVRNMGLDMIASNLAEYAEYIIQGHGTWSPDPFIENIFLDNEQLIVKTIEDEINNEFR